MLTKRTRYGLRALTILAEARGEPVLIQDIASPDGIPRKFLEQILRDLKQQGIVVARRGRGGGYALKGEPKDYDLSTVIRLLDGPYAPVPCLSRLAYQACEECPDEATCGTRLALLELHQAMRGVLERLTLEDIVQRSKHATEALDTGNYSI